MDSIAMSRMIRYNATGRNDAEICHVTASGRRHVIIGERAVEIARDQLVGHHAIRLDERVLEQQHLARIDGSRLEHHGIIAFIHEFLATDREHVLEQRVEGIVIGTVELLQALAKQFASIRKLPLS
jgi:hypothetical protein